MPFLLAFFKVYFPDDIFQHQNLLIFVLNSFNKSIFEALHLFDLSQVIGQLMSETFLLGLQRLNI